MDGSVIPASEISASALQAERMRLEIVAQNLANMNTTRGPNGQVYRRKLVTFESAMQQAQGVGQTAQPAGVRVSQIAEDAKPLVKVYMPGHPHADAKGMVTMPNVDMVEEMADMMTATRSYEANLQVLRSGKQMFDRSLEIGTAR
ncbi:MAG: flagellar basal body rod protein FlgC [Verrucomicrobiota bacterium]